MRKNWIIVAHDSYNGKNNVSMLFGDEGELIDHLDNMIDTRIKEYKDRVEPELCQEILVTPLDKFSAKDDAELSGTLQFQTGEVVDYSAFPMDKIKG